MAFICSVKSFFVVTRDTSLMCVRAVLDLHSD